MVDNVIDYKLLYLQEKVNSLTHELAFIQSRFGQLQAELQKSKIILGDYMKEVELSSFTNIVNEK